MAMFVVNHKVNDFSTWKLVYDAHQATRNKFGIHDHFVIQSENDPNDVTIIGEGTEQHLTRIFHKRRQVPPKSLI